MRICGIPQNSDDHKEEEYNMINQTLDKMTSMRLRDMAAEYRRQTELPAMKELPFEERFSLMVEAEWFARKNRKLARLISSADLPERDACLADIDYDPKRKLDRAHIARLSDCGFIKEKRHLLITGKTGTGKTWFASAFANAACMGGYKVKCFKTIRLLKELTLGRNDGTWIKTVDALLAPDLLVLDDFGMEPLDAVHSRDLFEVLDERRYKGSVLIAAQMPVSEWHGVIADKTAADAVMDRLANNNSYRLELSGPSRRGRNAKSEQKTIEGERKEEK
jgi:DNA replication protein DnaC